MAPHDLNRAPSNDGPRQRELTGAVLKRPRRIGGLDIPRPVASPQSRTPFLQAQPMYRAFDSRSTTRWTSESCLVKSNQTSGTHVPFPCSAGVGELNPVSAKRGEDHRMRVVR